MRDYLTTPSATKGWEIQDESYWGVDTESDSETEHLESESGIAESWEFEISEPPVPIGYPPSSPVAPPAAPPANLRDRDYVMWVQSSLNRLLTANLVVDGSYGSATRSAVHAFQLRSGLTADGVAGPQTRQAILDALKAGPTPPIAPPRPTPPVGGQPSLVSLDQFSRSFVDEVIASGRLIDCADLAIEIWIRFAEAHRIPIEFRIRNPRGTSPTRRSDFATVDQFIRFVQGNQNARGLANDTIPVPGGDQQDLRNAVCGDVFLWTYVSEVTGRLHQWGHTQVYNRNEVSPSGSNCVGILQGSLQVINGKPMGTRVTRGCYPIGYFYKNHYGQGMTVNGAREPHTRKPVGPGPRRFRGFAHLR